MSTSKFPVVIGRSERLSIQGIAPDIPAKIDTGAYRSSIHCISKKLITAPHGEKLKVELLGHPASPVVYNLEFADFERVSITNSFGSEEERFEVTLKIKLGPKVFNTSFTLADRANNLFPVLVGRKLLKKRFLVDVSRATVDRIKLKEDFGITTPIDEEDLEN